MIYVINSVVIVIQSVRINVIHNEQSQGKTLLTLMIIMVMRSLQPASAPRSLCNYCALVISHQRRGL